MSVKPYRVFSVRIEPKEVIIISDDDDDDFEPKRSEKMMFPKVDAHIWLMRFWTEVVPSLLAHLPKLFISKTEDEKGEVVIVAGDKTSIRRAEMLMKLWKRKGVHNILSSPPQGTKIVIRRNDISQKQFDIILARYSLFQKIKKLL